MKSAGAACYIYTVHIPSRNFFFTIFVCLSACPFVCLSACLFRVISGTAGLFRGDFQWQIADDIRLSGYFFRLASPSGVAPRLLTNKRG